MKEIYLYSGRGGLKAVTNEFVQVSDEDYEYLNQWKWCKMSIYHTENKIYYARRYETINGKFTAILMHRVILSLTDRKIKADHIDSNGLNNQRCNLRQVSHAQNMSNRKSSSKSNSTYLGVHKNKRGTFLVTCKYEGKILTKSGIHSEDIAAQIYNKFAMQLKGEYARLNTIK